MVPLDEVLSVRLSGPRALLRWGEFIALYLMTPALIAGAVDPAGRAHGFMRAVGLGWLVSWAEVPGRMIFPILLGVTVVIVAVLLADQSFDRSRLWGWERAREDLPRVVFVWGVCAVGLLGLTWAVSAHTGLMPESAFMRLPRENPRLMMAIWLVYPLVSAYPQEVTHRVFFWHRYRVLMPNRWVMIGMNGVVFAWMHALFWNWVALAMTLAGGLLFAYTYDRARSALASGIEHGLYGNWCFTIGLGWFVYAGSIGG